jgi:mRNA-degrading endonuclease RelE of RelBE toxin-antitoxin system
MVRVMSQKKVVEKIEKELEKIDPKIEEYVRETLNYLKSIVESFGGLPTHTESPDFYAALDSLFNMLRQEGVRISLKDIAEYLGVDYVNMRKHRSLWKKETEDYGINETVQAQVPQLPDAVMSQPQQQIQHPLQNLPQPPSFKSATARQVEKKIVDVVRKKVEDVIREEAEVVFKIGKEFYARWKPKCYSSGYEDLVECMHKAVEFFFEYKDVVEMLESELETCKNSVKYLLVTQKKDVARLALIEKAKELLRESYRLPPDEQKKIVDKVLSTLEKLVI